MTLMSEITRVSNNIAAAYTALDEKGATLPESQNSANLADTIATVPSGGNSDFAAFKQMVFGIENFTGSAKYGDFISRGFTPSKYCTEHQSSSIGYSSNTGFIGFYFDNDLDKIWVRPVSNFASVWGIKVPDDATVTDLAEAGASTKDTCFEVDFSNSAERWVVLIQDSSSSINCFNFPGTTNFGSGYNTVDIAAICSHVKYCCFKNNSVEAMAYSSSAGFECLNTICRYSSVLEGVDFYNKMSSVYGINDAQYHCAVFSPRSWLFDVKKFIDDNFVSGTITYGTTQMTAASTKSAFYSSFSYGRNICMTKKFPFVLDFSSCSASSNTFYIGNKTNSWANSSPVFGPVIQEMFMIPPDMNINWQVDGGYISPASIKYLAQNSPSVSSRTLTIGSRNIEFLNDYDDTVITTLTSKGWTVN